MIPATRTWASIPEVPDAVFILTNPKVSEEVVQQCVDLGIQRVWMHCLMGTKPGLAAKHDQRIARGGAHVPREWGFQVIPGSCPNQFLEPDFGHRLMRGIFGTIGFLRVDGQQ